MPLSEDDRRRLVMLLGMLGSEFEGERAAAALKADQLVRKAGLSWAEVVGARMLPPPPETIRPSVAGSSPFMIYCYVKSSDCPLSAWERQFMESIGTLSRLTAKQGDVAARLLNRAEVAWRMKESFR
jgi:hypothetical protein